MARLALVLILLAASVPAAAQEAAVGGALAAPEVAPERLHDELRTVRAAMERAMGAKDVDGLLAHVDDRVVLTAMNGELVHGKGAVRAYFARMMQGPEAIVKNITVRIEPDALSELHGGDTAIAFGASDDHYELSEGLAFDVTARWSATLGRTGGAWKILAFHYSVNPFENPILDGQRKLMMAIALGASLACAVVFFFVGRAVGRRRGKAA